jgi:segregation and condensation protein B
MELSQIIPHIEALIFASDRPLGHAELLEVLNNALAFIEDRATIEQVEAAVEGIKEKYDAEFYAFELRQTGGGWQFLTKKEYHKTVAQLNGDKFLKRLSVAALETLAIIAYKQPITKSEIEAIRGVNCDYAVQKLLEKDLVVITGRNEDAVGKPLVYGTSKSFMDYFGINSTADLPKINEVLMEELIQATIVNQDRVREEDSAEVNAIESNASEAPVAEVENVKDEIAGTHHAEVENTEADIAGEENSDEETAVEENTTDETSVNVFEEEGAEGKQDKQKGGQSDDSEA